MEPTALAAQQAAIQQVRARFERGELDADTFERALDALLLARTADECQAILRALPISPLASLAALEPARPAQPPAAPTRAPLPALARASRHIIAFMGQTKRLHRPWTLNPTTHTLAVMGEVQLDLRLADLPPRATLRVMAIMGAVTLYVPENARVTVRSTVLLSDTQAVGEHTSGVIAFGHEEHLPDDGDLLTPDLRIEVFALMANVKVMLVGPRSATITALARDTVQSAADAFRRGLRQGHAAGAPLPDNPSGATSPHLRLARPSE